MELSLPAWLGAFCGMIVAAAIYVPGIRIVERRLRASSGAKTLEHASSKSSRLCAAGFWVSTWPRWPSLVIGSATWSPA